MDEDYPTIDSVLAVPGLVLVCTPNEVSFRHPLFLEQAYIEEEEEELVSLTFSRTFKLLKVYEIDAAAGSDTGTARGRTLVKGRSESGHEEGG